MQFIPSVVTKQTAIVELNLGVSAWDTLQGRCQ